MSAFFAELAEAVRQRSPRAWRRPAGLPALSPERTFAALCAAAAHPDVATDGPHVRYRTWVGGASVPCTGHLPRPSDGSVRAWLDRVETTPGELGAIVNDFQSADAESWAFARALIGPLVAALGLPVGGTSLDAFVGRYGRTAFGLHKDDQDVVTVVVEGRKRFHVWPFEAFAEAPGVTPALRIRNHRLGDADLAPDAPAPIVLEGGPGDVLFWPAECWHVAVPVDGEPAVTVGIGIFRPSDPMRFLGEAVRMAADAGDDPPLPTTHLGVRGDLGADIDRIWDGVLTWLGRPEVRSQARELLLGWASAQGMAAVPTLPDPTPAERWRLAPNSTIVWYREDDALLLSLVGTVYRLPWSPALPAIFERILTGEAFDMTELGELGEGIEGEALEGIVGLLASVGVVEGV